MIDKKTIPIRGIKHDWYEDKEQEILDNNREYARISIRNNLMGSPDFEPYKNFLVKSVQENDSRGQQTVRKRPKIKRITLIHKKETTKK